MAISSMFPWLSRLLKEDQAVLGEDWWPNGIQANARASKGSSVITTSRASPITSSRSRTYSLLSYSALKALPIR
jgi:hypothetical protein